MSLPIYPVAGMLLETTSVPAVSEDCSVLQLGVGWIQLPVDLYLNC